MCLAHLKNWYYRRLYEHEPPVITGNTTYSQLNDIVKETLDCTCRCENRYYDLCSFEDINLFILQDATDLFVYVPDGFIHSYDCDRFTDRLIGQFSIPQWGSIPVGKVYSTKPSGEGHACVAFVDDQLELWIVEPQTDEIFNPMELEKWQFHTVTF